MAKVFLTGSGWFGHQAAERIAAEGHQLVGIAAPLESRRGGVDLLAAYARRLDVPLTPAPLLRADSVPAGTDAIMAAHSHAFVGRLTRAKARHALGYHPSLLPLHRGRDAVRWQARLGERVVGGSIYHLTDRIDGGPIAAQQHLIVGGNLSASTLWRDHLAPLGLDLIARVLADVDTGRVAVLPQNDRLATWEPSFDSEPVYRPELLELGGA